MEIQQSIAGFFMWAKMFYFLRSLDATGFYINMQFRVAKRSVSFLFIYVLVLFAFSSSNFVLLTPEQRLPSNELFLTYLASLGEFDTDFGDRSTHPVVMKVIFIMFTLIVNIV